MTLAARLVFFSIFCGAVASAATAPPARAVDPVALLKAQFENARRQLVESEEQQREIMSSLFQINKKMKHLVSERSKTDEQRMTLQASAKVLADRVLLLEKRIKDQKTLLQVRLNAIYRLGGQGLARLVFSSASSAELERNLKILGLVAQRDLTLMKDYTKSVDEMALKQRRFVARLASLKKTQRKLNSQQAAINQESSEKARLLDSIRKDKAKSLSKLRILREKGERLGLAQDDELLDLLLKPSFFEKRGQLSPPVSGPIVRAFGLWKDSEYNVTMNHKGLTYQTPAGRPVTAVSEGRVAFVGPVEGFGITTIIDHGDHYYSVYGGLSRADVQEGTRVEEGQTVASTAGGLYFEIRHFSEPYDPTDWMKGRPQ